jgi:dTDP-4-dehydrorhamnose reductase
MEQTTTMADTQRILIIGAGGMLGHKLYQILRQRFEVRATVRGSVVDYERFGIFDPNDLIGGVDVEHLENVARAVGAVKPDVIINAVGVIKQLPTAKDPLVSLTINSVLPHRLAALAAAVDARFITLSTDCVFNGRRGMYTEADVADAEDLYGRTKYLGEVTTDNALTLRTSIIGRELGTSHSLVEWFLSNRVGQVKGFRHAIYSGFPTVVMARLIGDLIESHPELSGLYQISSEPINKYDLLLLLRDAYQVDIEIEPDDEFRIDRSLDSSRFRQATGFEPQSWPEMIKEMAADSYKFRETHN